MAVVNSNNVYLNWDGVDLSAVWIGEIDRSDENSTVETTSGAGVTHVMRNSGLSDNTMSFSVVVDDTTFNSYKSVLQTGNKGTLIYGPEGAVTGKPKFQASMVLASLSGPNATIAKDVHMYELEFQGDGPPTAELHSDVF